MSENDSRKPRQTGKPKELRAVEARQGVASGYARYVLGISLALVIIAFAIIYFMNFW
ncbi:MAG TPA: hypothetical protein VIY09_03905 [Rhizomicrobium sp.]